ncbi:glycosyltransferase [Latilactobacillus sakei]|uniref:glycosyltransferase n=1 Tax=Latilactobacillus sakei TaxID=1599 RepID=UPI001F4C1858|nr:glycosyltransferase [Latilactobacillus sakei]UNC19055.1 glycosyltransferase [Latilactobacillus sakei]
MKIGSIIVTYNPDITILNESINIVTQQVSCIRIVDNGSKNITEIEGLVTRYTNVEIINLKQNYGIATAQNKGFQTFQDDEYDWILTLDQDTILPEDYVNRLISSVKEKDAGIITGAYIDLKWEKAKIKDIRISRSPRIQKIHEEISSGNLVSVNAWNKVNGFDDKLFIDYVDFDFDYKLIRAGYGIYRVNDVEFSHEIGSPIRKGLVSKILFINKHELFDHSAQRIFYINRNRLIVRKRYPEFGSYNRMLIREILNLREIFVMQGSKHKKFKKAISGILKGILFSE